MQRTKSKYNIMTLSNYEHTPIQLQPHKQQYIDFLNDFQTSKSSFEHNQFEDYSDKGGKMMQSEYIVDESQNMNEQDIDQQDQQEFNEENDKSPIYKINGKHINQLNANKQNIGTDIQKIPISKYLAQIEQNCQKEPVLKNKIYVNMKVNLSDCHRNSKNSKFVIINKHCSNQTFNPQQQQHNREQSHRRQLNNEIKLVYVHLSTQMRDNIFYQISNTKLNISLGTIMVQQQQLLLHYNIPQHPVSEVLLTNQYIQISINQNIYRYIYRHHFMHVQPTPTCIQNIVGYCLWVLDQIRLYQVKQKIEDLHAVEQIVYHKYYRYQGKQIQLQLMKNAQNKIRATIKILYDEDTTDTKEQKLQFNDIGKILCKHMEEYLTEIIGETIYKSMVKIYSYYWHQYVSDL